MVYVHKNPAAILSAFTAGMSLKTIYVYCVKIISQILWCNAQIQTGSFSIISKNCARIFSLWLELGCFLCNTTSSHALFLCLFCRCW